MRKGFRLCCAIGAVMILGSASATAKAEEYCAPGRQNRSYLVTSRMEEGSKYHKIGAAGSLCDNTFRCQAHVEACRDIRIPKRRYSDNSKQRYTREIYLNCYCCTSCGYVFSEEELENLLSLEAQDADR